MTTIAMRAKKNKDCDFETGVLQKGRNIIHNRVKYTPKTPTQELYVKHLQNDDVKILLGIGPAGTGKTLFACITAIDALKRGDIHKVILTRPVVSVDEEIGFLPGNLNAKMAPWTRPIFDIFLEFFSQTEIDMMLKNGVIEISPLAFMRGRTFKKSFIIADEMQNSSPNQMMMLTTRIGDNSRMIITGDLNQTDRGANNGLRHFMDKYNRFMDVSEIDTGDDDFVYGYEYGEDDYSNDDCGDDCDLEEKEETSVLEPTKCDIQIVCFQNEDVERSAIVSKVLAVYATPEIKVQQKTQVRTISMGKFDNDCAMIPKLQKYF
jgi:phosphate starvation-inducible PhoH-like protein